MHFPLCCCPYGDARGTSRPTVGLHWGAQGSDFGMFYSL